MKSLILLLFFLMLFGTSYSEDSKHLTRINEDKNIIGYVVFNRPDNIYQKLNELNKSFSKNYLKIFEEEYEELLPIIQDSTSIVIVYYYFEEDVSTGYYITVKNKKIFDCDYVSEIDNKVTINNTLIFTEEDDEESIKIHKLLQPKISVITTKNDIEWFYDINHILHLDEKTFTPNELNVVKQFDFFNFSFNFNQLEIASEILFTPTANSNLQKMLAQSKIEDTTLLDALGKSNLFINITQFDFSKGLLFFEDIKKITAEKNANNEIKKEETLNNPNIFETAGIVRLASKWNFDSKLTNSHILKFDKAKKIIAELIKGTNADEPFLLNPTLNKILSYKGNKYFFNEYFEYYLDNVAEKTLRENNVKISIFEKSIDFDLFKISFEDKQKEKLIDDTKSIYFSANNNLIVLGDTLQDTKELSSKLKIPTTKSNITLDSINYFKSGFMSYSDINLQTFFKLLFSKENKTLGGELFNKYFKGNFKPLKLAVKMDGNLSLHLHVDMATYKPILELYLAEILGDLDEIEDTDEGDNKKPDSQP